MKTLMWVVSGLIVLGGASAQACSCSQPESAKAELAKANVVLQGTVENIKLIVHERGFKQNLVNLKLEQSWKGLDHRYENLAVRTSPNEAACGYGFRVGESYVVYAYLHEDGTLITNLCTRNAPTEKASQDLAELGEGIRPR